LINDWERGLRLKRSWVIRTAVPPPKRRRDQMPRGIELAKMGDVAAQNTAPVGVTAKLGLLTLPFKGTWEHH